MTNFFDNGDDLSDMLSGPAPAAPKALPEGDAFARVRAMADKGPVAPAFKVACRKCNGSGTWRGGYSSGPCFACKGKGSFERKTSPAKLAANREKAMERKVRSAQNNWDAFVEQYPAYAQVLTRGANSNNPSWSNVCVDVMGKVRKYGDLHPGTLAMLQRSVDRDAQYAAQRAQKAAEGQQAVAGVNVANLVDVFKRADAAGLKRFSLRFVDLRMEMDKRDHNTVWVSKSGYGSPRYGVLTVSTGAFRPGRDFTAEVKARLELVSADPMAAAKTYTQVTSSCSVCGLHLENAVSVEQGMGPVCAGRLDPPGGKFVEVKAGADF